MTTNYVKNSTWNDNDATTPVSAARLNNLDNGVFDAHWRHFAKAQRTTAATIPNAVTTTVTLNADVYDPYGLHDTATNTSRITVIMPGVYEIKGHASFAVNASATGLRYVFILQNGVIVAGNSANGISNGDHPIEVSHIASVAASTYFEVAVYQSIGGNLGLSSSATYPTDLAVSLVSAG